MMNISFSANRETGALCAMKEVDLVPDDPKSAESIKQLEQVNLFYYVCSCLVLFYWRIVNDVEVSCCLCA